MLPTMLKTLMIMNIIQIEIELTADGTTCTYYWNA